MRTCRSRDSLICALRLPAQPPRREPNRPAPPLDRFWNPPPSSPARGRDQQASIRVMVPVATQHEAHLMKPTWSASSTTATDFTLHQLAPYIGRMKTSMARALVLGHSRKGDLIVDPFCGSGVVAMEAAASGRRATAGDWNPYAVLLTRAKLFPPPSLLAAQNSLTSTWDLALRKIRDQDLRSVPRWVRRFFHPETLRSALAFRDACVERQEHFLLACLLGILHHQRPGFLSFPSSHLVPYLRDQNFPRKDFAALYERRDVLPRLQAKLRRAFRRQPEPYPQSRTIFAGDARRFPRVSGVQAVITSPPYMNELDYVRDNRLRLWFIDRALPAGIELRGGDREAAYISLLRDVCLRLAAGIIHGGSFVLVVGDVTRGGGPTGRTVGLTRHLFSEHAALSEFVLAAIYEDRIPDIRRSRRECRGTKTETVLIYKKS